MKRGSLSWLLLVVIAGGVAGATAILSEPRPTEEARGEECGLPEILARLSVRSSDEQDDSKPALEQREAADAALIAETADACSMDRSELEALIRERGLLSDLRNIRRLVPEGLESEYPKLARAFLGGVQSIDGDR